MNPNAETGKPIIHRYVDKPYTGFMPIAARTDRDDFYILRVKGDFEDEILYHYDKDGQPLSKNQLGAKRLTYRAELNLDGTLYFDNSHKIEHYDPKSARFLHMENEIPTKDTRPQSISGRQLRVDFGKGHGRIEIFDCRDEKLIMKLKNEFTATNVNCALTAGNLIVHTDYGILSIYKMNIEYCLG